MELHGKFKFKYLSVVAKLVLTIPHSNAEEEQVFSLVDKSMTPNLGLDKKLPSLLTVTRILLKNDYFGTCVHYQDLLLDLRRLTGLVLPSCVSLTYHGSLSLALLNSVRVHWPIITSYKFNTYMIIA